MYDPSVSFDAVTVLHQFAWDGDIDAVAMFLALPQCTTRLVNAKAGQRINWDGSAPLPGSTHREPLTDERHQGSTALHVACVAGRASIVRLLLRDGRADPNHPDTGRMSPLVAAVGCTYIFDGRQNHLVAECIRELTLDPRTVVDFWYTKLAGDYPGSGARSHVLHRLAKYGFLEATYHVLAALPKLDPDSVKQDSPGGTSSATPILSPIEQCAIGPPCGTMSDTHHPMLCFLIEVSNAGGFKKWRAEKARELMVARALVARARARRVLRDGFSRARAVQPPRRRDIPARPRILLVPEPAKTSTVLVRLHRLRTPQSRQNSRGSRNDHREDAQEVPN